MQQSQAPQPETQAQEPSQSQQGSPADQQPAPTRQVGKSAKKPRKQGAPERAPGAEAQDTQRAEQVQKRIEVERKNPFSRENRASRMQELLREMREDRGVSEPRAKAEAHETRREGTGDGDGAHRVAEPGGQPGDGVARDARVDEPSANKPSADKPQETPEWYKSEQKAAQALAKAENERAASEKARSEAEAAVKRLADAKDDPIQFMSEVGMTKEEFAAYTANGGQLTAEQKKLRQMTERLEQLEARASKAENDARAHQEQARRSAEDAAFANDLNNLTYIPHMGGIAAVRQRQSLLSQQTGQPVSLKDAAQHLEQEMGQGLERLLQNKKIRSSLKLDVNTPNAGPVGTPPRTLNNSVAAESSQEEARPHPLDFAAKRKLWAQRVARDRETQSGRQ